MKNHPYYKETALKMKIYNSEFTTPLSKRGPVKNAVSAFLLSVIAATSLQVTSAQAKPAQCFTTDDGHYSCNFKFIEGNGSFEISAANKPTIYLFIDTPGVASASADFGTGRVVPLPGTYYRQQDDGACWHTNATNNKICAW